MTDSSPAKNSGAQPLQRYRLYREMLERRPRTKAELAARAETSEKTVQRDLDRLRKDWNWDVRYSPSTRAWKAQGDLPIAILSLSEVEAEALLVAEPALRGYGSGAFAAGIHSALRKIIASLQAPVSPERPPVEFGLYSIRDTDPTLYQQCRQAAVRSERLRLRYYSPDKNETTVREVDPYLTENQQGAWYLIAYCHLKKGLRDFAISPHRMLDVTNTGVFFNKDQTLDLEGHRRSRFGMFAGGTRETVELRFEASQRIYQLERALFPGETREELPDGRLLSRFPAPVDTPGVRRWVLQYGSEVEVLAPPSLREVIRNEAETMGRRHADA
jgi:predicted DNA-binding transcriptional regulator YafY